ncbi:penicillin-binding protein activator LpoB [Alkalilimnicola ehrlichii]|uniref:Penicillin-binding protein activator LpoB n=1 Tax=Alkalilimnicola ehrlichii TaxID=351052 RepID=A0A3E0WZF6_9GAMM|nr:penicillin-binding protein activator LpoB [Alkalilimnicola ehrlichii]RFA30063.1 penicillin-binding protein activator LpoB [Alkalilimnicola ehrlichii]RFA37406.1 penicillin-binding protein activator LpoB [Alkalilimnicola ehrlichii]
MQVRQVGALTWVIMLLVVLALSGCSTRVDRVGAEETHDLSGRWNDTDSRMVSEEMVADLLSRAWLTEHAERRGGRPTVIVGEVRNLSHEHINVNTFIRDIERELINAGRVTFVAGGREREAIREERADQDLHATDATRSAMGREIGADYMLTGTINTIMDVEGRTQVAYYQVDLALTSMADNRRVWVGQKKIKKVIQRGRFRS